MTTDPTATDGTEHSTNWQVDYDVALIEIRDPVAEALGVLEQGEPFVVTYKDAVKRRGTPARPPRVPIGSLSLGSTPYTRTAIRSGAKSRSRRPVRETMPPTV